MSEILISTCVLKGHNFGETYKAIPLFKHWNMHQCMSGGVCEIFFSRKMKKYFSSWHRTNPLCHISLHPCHLFCLFFLPYG